MRSPPADLGRAQAAAQAEAAQAAALAEAQRLVDAAKAALPVPFRPDGPPLAYIFDEPPGVQQALTTHQVPTIQCVHRRSVQLRSGCESHLICQDM